MTNARPSPPSRLAQAALVAYAVALAGGSLYPLSGWRHAGVPLFGFLFDPWPRWWTGFDVAFNVAIYLPGGLMLAMQLRSRLPRWLAIGVAVLVCSAVALGLEALQSLLPNRVPSRLDWLANTGGALLGALLHPWGERVADVGQRSLEQRIAIDRTDSAVGATLMAVWLCLQWPTQRLLFGQGDLNALWRTLADWTGLSEVASPWRLNPAHGMAAEALAVSMAMVGIGLLVREVLPTRAPRAAITGAMIFAAVAIKTVASAAMVGPAKAVNWLTAGAQGGLLIGATLLALLATARRTTRLALAIAALAISSVLATVFPVDTYFSTDIAAREDGSWRNLDGFLRGTATVWPYLAIAWCAGRWRALRRQPRSTEPPYNRSEP